jgi:hypothetical protein
LTFALIVGITKVYVKGLNFFHEAIGRDPNFARDPRFDTILEKMNLPN